MAKLLVTMVVLIAALASRAGLAAPQPECPAWMDAAAGATKHEAEPAPAYGFGLTVSTDRKFPLYAVGEDINLTIKVQRPAYISVIGFGTDGKESEIYPNQFQPNERLEPGQKLILPDRQLYHLTAAKPAGCSLIKVIAKSAPGATLRSLKDADSRLAGNADWQESTLTLYVVE